MEIEHDTTAGSLKERLGADQEDWVFEKQTDGISRYIPDHASIPESANSLSIVPQYIYGGIPPVPFHKTWDTQKRLNRLEAEALFITHNRKWGSVEYDTEDGHWFMVERLPIGNQWNVQTASILIDVPHGTPGYPILAPSWFWVDKDLRTREGLRPANLFEAGDSTAHKEYANNGWGHFCLKMKTWHPRTDIFFAQGDSLISFLEALEVVFHDKPRV
jgi:hypothetical protein